MTKFHIGALPLGQEGCELKAIGVDVDTQKLTIGTIKVSKFICEATGCGIDRLGNITGVDISTSPLVGTIPDVTNNVREHLGTYFPCQKSPEGDA